MSRTIRKTTGRDGRIDYDAPGVRSIYAREQKWARKKTNRQARNAARATLRTAPDLEAVAVPEPRRTGGWLSW